MVSLSKVTESFGIILLRCVAFQILLSISLSFLHYRLPFPASRDLQQSDHTLWCHKASAPQNSDITLIIWKCVNLLLKKKKSQTLHQKNPILSLEIHTKIRETNLCPSKSAILLKSCHYLGRQRSNVLSLIAQRLQMHLNVKCSVYNTFARGIGRPFSTNSLEWHCCDFYKRCWADPRLQKVTLLSATQ